MKNVMADFSDERLVLEAKMGSAQAFSELVRRYQERIYHTIFRFTRNHHDTDDLAQETFMTVYKSIKTFEQKSSFYTWVYRIAVNLTLNFLKKRKKEQGRKEFSDGVLYENPREPEADSPEDSSTARELGEKLEAAVRSLPFPFRSTFILVSFQGMTHGQAAKILGCSENTVSWRMFKARKMLQKELKPFLGEVRP